jgi:hypothetical protein
MASRRYERREKRWQRKKESGVRKRRETRCDEKVVKQRGSR